MGIVWRAFDEQLERDVALKFLPEMVTFDEHAVRELKRETKKSQELRHHRLRANRLSTAATFPIRSKNVTPVSMQQRREDLEVTGAPIPPEWEKTVAACVTLGGFESVEREIEVKVNETTRFPSVNLQRPPPTAVNSTLAGPSGASRLA